MIRFAAGLIVFLLALPSQANLIANPSNDLPLVNGEISGWTEVVGADWQQRSANPAAFDGNAYFFAGAVANGTLRQVVDVSSFAGAIDASLQQFQFTGRVRAFLQTPSDSSRIVLRYLAADTSVLATFDSEEIKNTAAWQLVSDTRIAPALTRSISIDLIAKRYNGTNNDGYFDVLSLEAVPVPEPEQYLSMLVGLLVLGVVRRRNTAASIDIKRGNAHELGANR